MKAPELAHRSVLWFLIWSSLLAIWKLKMVSNFSKELDFPFMIDASVKFYTSNHVGVDFRSLKLLIKNFLRGLWNQVEQIMLFVSVTLPLTLLTQFCGPWKAWCVGSRWSSCCTAEVFLKQRLLWRWLSAGLCYGVFVIFLLTIPHRFSLWFKSGELADPSSTAITSGDKQMEECAVDASVVSSQGKAWYLEYNSCRSFAEDVCVWWQQPQSTVKFSQFLESTFLDNQVCNDPSC